MHISHKSRKLGNKIDWAKVNHRFRWHFSPTNVTAETRCNLTELNSQSVPKVGLAPAAKNNSSVELSKTSTTTQHDRHVQYHSHRQNQTSEPSQRKPCGRFACLQGPRQKCFNDTTTNNLKTARSWGERQAWYCV